MKKTKKKQRHAADVDAANATILRVMALRCEREAALRRSLDADSEGEARESIYAARLHVLANWMDCITTESHSLLRCLDQGVTLTPDDKTRAINCFTAIDVIARSNTEPKATQ